MPPQQRKREEMPSMKEEIPPQPKGNNLLPKTLAAATAGAIFLAAVSMGK
ncbi:MAG: hypothetical protein K0M45_12140 [Candidatus Paracaedibacteraceae bacterium]|nr:hypothetical protein [Candidatus Paracaedibacteraceae bacterium]